MNNAFFIFSFLICASGQSYEGQPPCRIDPKFSYSDVSNAGCLIVSGNEMLSVRQLSGKLGLPGGTKDKGEIAQCTAHRETWEETGLDIKVGRVLKRYKNRFILFHCNSEKEIPSNIAVPDSGKNEIREILFINPGTVLDSEWKSTWRFPRQARDYTAIIDQLGADK